MSWPCARCCHCATTIARRTWATRAFRLATSGLEDRTQLQPHICHANVGDIVEAIDSLDADVNSIEAARSGMAVAAELRRFGYGEGVGPGVYDVHSPRIPTAAEMAVMLRIALSATSPPLLWVNPDCGLKTRTPAEVAQSLAEMVAAAREVRAEIAAANGAGQHAD